MTSRKVKEIIRMLEMAGIEIDLFRSHGGNINKIIPEPCLQEFSPSQPIRMTGKVYFFRFMDEAASG